MYDDDQRAMDLWIGDSSIYLTGGPGCMGIRKDGRAYGSESKRHVEYPIDWE